MRLTADDVLDIPVPDHLSGYELVDGELVEVSLPSPPHARLVAQVTYQLMKFIEEHGLGGVVYGEVGVVLPLRRDPERLRGPDASYVSAGTLAAHGGEPGQGWFRLVPDLVIEVDSPGRRPAVEQKRIQDYLDAGVRILWVVHTEARSATIYHADGSARLVRESDALLGDPVLPGFTLPLARLFGERTP
jgi:Uma2 family endonuclease